MLQEPRLARKASVVLGVALLAGSVASCSGRADAPSGDTFVDQVPPPPSPLVRTMPETGRHGGRFVIVGPTGPQSFNPLTVTTAFSTDIGSLLFTRLTLVDRATQETGPGLAESWNCSTDGRTCTFHLRAGARFSDGHAITADDVLFTFGALYDSRVTARGRDMFLVDGQPLAVTAPDPATVVVTAPSPYGSLLGVVGSLHILPRHTLGAALEGGTFNSAYAVDTAPEALVTSGPFVLKQYRPNERVVLGRNPYWFGVDATGQRLPYLDELVFTVAPDQDAADLMLRSGEADAIAEPRAANYQWYEEHKADQHLTVHDAGPELGSTYFVFNLNPAKGRPGYLSPAAKWFANPVMRRAISMAIDREAISTSVMFGVGVKSWAAFSPGDRTWGLPDVAHLDYNPDEARRLLASLGWRDRDGDGTLEDEQGVTVQFSLKTTAGNATRVGMANFIRDDLARVGIKVAVVPTEFNTLVTNLRRDLQFDTMVMGGAPPRADPIFASGFWRVGGRVWHQGNSGPWTPEEQRVDRLMADILATSDESARRAQWKELHTIANDQAWVVWLPIQRVLVPVRDRIANVRPATGATTAGVVVWNAEELFVKRTK